MFFCLLVVLGVCGGWFVCCLGCCLVGCLRGVGWVFVFGGFVWLGCWVWGFGCWWCFGGLFGGGGLGFVVVLLFLGGFFVFCVGFLCLCCVVCGWVGRCCWWWWGVVVVVGWCVGWGGGGGWCWGVWCGCLCFGCVWWGFGGGWWWGWWWCWFVCCGCWWCWCGCGGWWWCWCVCGWIVLGVVEGVACGVVFVAVLWFFRVGLWVGFLVVSALVVCMVALLFWFVSSWGVLGAGVMVVVYVRILLFSCVVLAVVFGV
ncbi:hypothetical protein, partial [Neisseria sp. P0013.S004]|uniref:hypothetical protein n=1 Tax=Neisseria sp. P0013.S004 TaxID=3436740 RepID=UPI003F7F4FEA